MRVARRLHGIVNKFFAQDGSSPSKAEINPWESVRGLLPPLLGSWGGAREEATQCADALSAKVTSR
eukprot:16429944-Heterocapsa_arctica.AAC.1